MYRDYTWFDNAARGQKSGTGKFNKLDGNQVAELIESFMKDTGYNSEFTAKALERIIRNSLPENITQPQEVRAWLDNHFKFGM